MTRSDGLEYLPNDPSPWKAQGRSQANTTAEDGDVKGIRFLEYDGQSDILLLHVDGKYRTAVAATSSLTFQDGETGLEGGPTLDTVHYNNVYYALNGVDRNRAVSTVADSVEADATFTPTFDKHGMLANTTAPTADATTGTGITLSVNNTLVYWVEERVKDDDGNILKSNAETGSTTVTVTGAVANKDIIITRPAIVNSEATHWALYGAATNDTFPSGAEIAEVVIATTTITDTRTGTDPGIPGGSLYETLAVSIAGVTTQTARAGPPPIATTGDIFEDSLCLNDANDKTLVWFSWPDEPHKFPATNFIRFETKDADEVTLIRQVGQGLIVCLRDAIWRIAYLPRPEDAQFDRGRVKIQVEGAHGCVSGQAAAAFSFGQGQRLAYVSRYGLLVTDGFVWDVLSGDLEWEKAFNVSAIDRCVLTNNPRKYRLELRAPSAGSQVNDVLYFFHYHPSHAKTSGAGLRAKVTGPLPFPASSATVMNFNGLHYVMSGAANGKIYTEGVGNDDGDGNSFEVVCRTGDIYPDSEGNSCRIHALYLHHSAGYTGQMINGEVAYIDSNDPAAFEKPFSTSLAERSLDFLTDQGEAEAFQLEARNEDSLGAFRLNYWVMDFSSEGEAKNT
jgi:hypothetical protein